MQNARGREKERENISFTLKTIESDGVFGKGKAQVEVGIHCPSQATRKRESMRRKQSW